MNTLEEQLREVLGSARMRLDAGDVVGAGVDLDLACSVCAMAETVGVVIEDRAALLELVHACTLAAQATEKELRAQLARSTSAQSAGRAYDRELATP